VYSISTAMEKKNCKKCFRHPNSRKLHAQIRRSPTGDHTRFNSFNRYTL